MSVDEPGMLCRIAHALASPVRIRIMQALGKAVCGVFAHFGSRSLYYLLTSNLVIFTMAGKGIVPAISRKSVAPWTTPIQAPMGALCWTMVLLAALWFTAALANRGRR